MPVCLDIQVSRSPFASLAFEVLFLVESGSLESLSKEHRSTTRFIELQSTRKERQRLRGGYHSIFLFKHCLQWQALMMWDVSQEKLLWYDLPCISKALVFTPVGVYIGTLRCLPRQCLR